jgi:hypothetical protein
MTLNAKHVARWWKYKTQHQSHVPHVGTQWLESGQRQPLSSMAVAFTQQEDKNVPTK